MNVFRLIGDFVHLSAMIYLLFEIFRKKSCVGISGKMQILLAIVSSTRYADLFIIYISLYNTTMKLVFIGISFVIVYLIYFKFSNYDEHKKDYFPIEFLAIFGMMLAVLVNYNLDLLEVSWAFSMYLEAMAVIPQLFVESGNNVTIYILLLFTYRIFYCINWVYSYTAEGLYDLISILSAVVQISLYLVYFVKVIFPHGSSTIKEVISGILKKKYEPAKLEHQVCHI